MLDKIREYWAKQHWSIVQGASGVYCAALATWERFHPSVPQSPVITPGNDQVSSVITSSRYTMPFWMWFGIVVLSASISVPALMGILRSRKTRLRDKTLLLSRDIFKFMKGLPSRLETPPGATFEEIYANGQVRDNGRSAKLHHGYSHRFRQRVVDLSHELAENGITISAEHWEIDPPEIQREKNLRNIAESLVKIVVEMDTKDYVKSR